MTGAAGFTVLHVFHGRLVGAAFGLKQVGMATIAATKHFNVYGVREGDVAVIFILVENVTGMALGAVTVTGYAESIRPVVTGTAGFTLPHVFHGCLVGALFGLKQVGMTTVATLKHLNMDGV